MSLPSPVPEVHTALACPVLYVSPAVRCVRTQDGAVLLNLQQGVCFGMSPVGMKIWELLKANPSLSQVCECLCAEYPDIPSERVTEDVAQFVQELQTYRLVMKERSGSSVVPLPRVLAFIRRHLSTARSPGRVRKPRFLLWKALLGLAAFDVFRFGRNFCRTYEFVRGWNASDRTADEIADQVCAAVNHACVWYPKRVLCLQRSIVTTCLLRHCGIPAQMVMGAQKFPFKAHAWTEVDGRPLNERRDVQRLYLVWERC